MNGFLKRTIERMENKRQEVAEALLDWENISDKIGLAAAAGQSRITLAPAAPVRIRHTAAATAAIERLTREQFRHAWTEHRPNPTGPAGDQLEIEW